ncbi:short chain dehydrogenase/reductase family protein [Psychroflexus torquis ATCC 700755]|uniref:Short chain dehydrogenase/reductase family protein n=1 Tax=Psychroflexus torquis (strain ATCC 700755 / CIP 106069 / ACAM 623) TaxID=313595 RepID=K4IHR8_PSYTT|nr:SDR family oxidoreductase [Psychroflexus torquis]AFU69904.1 short chain dehydrogenase/reductase family protein [Psychroflexus torquis ATCC 700755]
MKILLTGANGYIGMRVLPLLLEQGHQVVCAVRSADRLSVDKETKERIDIIEMDLLDEVKPNLIPKDIDVAYYLVHSMSSSTSDFSDKEQITANHFNTYMKDTQVKQVIFLSGIVNEDNLSKHLESRKNVESILYKGNYHLTVIRAGIIVGSGSASFEIIRDLCEKLPLMITPKWVNTRCQPIGIRDVLKFLTGVLGKEETYDASFDIGGPDVLTYKNMMKNYAKVRGLSLTIVNVPIMTPKLSSYWLYFVTSTSYKLASNLVDSMRINVIAKDKRLQDILGIKPHTYEEAIEMAFIKIEQNQVISSWKDSKVSSRYSQKDLNKYIKVPKFGCLHDHQQMKADDPKEALEKIWAIGGKNGWYYANTLWKIRGYFDKLSGGVGLRRGRTNPDKINSGDSLDFWRVLMADKEERRLLLFAEMRVPGEAWLEFYIDDENVVHQNATFRPKGLIGRLYWYSMLPFHFFIFNGMLTKICKT